MNQLIPHTYAAECLLHIPTSKRLRPKSLAVSTTTVLMRLSGGMAAAASQMLDDLLQAATESFTGVAATSCGVAHGEVLPRHDETHHVQDPSCQLRVQCIDISSHCSCLVEELQRTLLAVLVGILSRLSPCQLGFGLEVKEAVPNRSMLHH